MPDFANPQQLIRHLIFHVLSPPESHAWGLVWRGRFDCLSAEPAAEKTCFRLRNLSGLTDANLETDRPDERSGLALPVAATSDLASLFQELMHTYQEEIERVQIRSQRLRWMTYRGGEAIHFDPYGIVLICFHRESKPVALTAFIPGATSADGVLRSREAPNDTHARVGGRSGMRRRGGPDQGDIRQRMNERRSADWNADQKIFYLVFRPALQFIRRRQPGAPVPGVSGDVGIPLGARNEPRRRGRVEMAEVKAALPPMSQLNYEGWRTYLVAAEGESTRNSSSPAREEMQ